MGAAPTIFGLKGQCFTVKLQTLNKQKRALSPSYNSMLKNIRVYCLALPPPITCIAIEAVLAVAVVRAVILITIL